MAGPAGDQDRWRMGDPHDADQVHPRRPTRNTVDGPAQGRGEVISSGSRRRNRGSHNARYVKQVSIETLIGPRDWRTIVHANG